MKNVEKYPHILENWLKHYISSMNDTGNLIPGDNTGEAPFGVKIIFKLKIQAQVSKNPKMAHFHFEIYHRTDEIWT